MEKNIKLRLLQDIGNVYEKSKDCKLVESFFLEIEKELSFLSEYFQTTKKQAFLISIVYAFNYKGDTVDFNDLIRYFYCNPMKILEYSDDFNFLHSSGIFRKKKSSHRIKLAGANDQFTINEKISEAIMQNESMPETITKKYTDIFELIEDLYELSNQRIRGAISTHELFEHTEKMISDNQHFSLINKIDNLKLCINDSHLFLFLIWRTISGEKSINIGRTLDVFYDVDNRTKRSIYMQKFISGENKLIKNDLIEIVTGHIFYDTKMKLTDNAYDLLTECSMHIRPDHKKVDEKLENLLDQERKAQMKNENVISPNDIPLIELIFSESEMKQLFLLKDSLNDKKFKEIQNRFVKRNLPKGIAILLHGEPGTGKTEIAKQLAKETNRKLMKVEISQSKSKWYGESEKIIKQLFSDYKEFVSECKRTPILFFNEADAIISKRQEIVDSSVQQSDNRIQNIILEELENFEGILIATTNLVSNLDPAFERRFLFKIQFKKPDFSIRARIWKSKFQFLSLQDCNLLAEKYDFSGGQIDNILLKKEIYEIINGKKVINPTVHYRNFMLRIQ